METELRELLDQARREYSAGAEAEALQTCATLIDHAAAGCDPNLIAEAATLVRPPVDPVQRARLHALAAGACSRLRSTGAEGDAAKSRVQALLKATCDPFNARPASTTTPPADPEGSFAALQIDLAALHDPRAVDDRLALARRAIAIGESTANREFEALGRSWAMDAYALKGRRELCLAELAAITVTVEKLSPSWQSRVFLVRASQALIDGRFADARDLAMTARDLGGPQSDAAFLYLPFVFEAARNTGDVSDILPSVRAAVEPLPFVARAWLCLALLESGLHLEAADEWRAIAPLIRDFPVRAPEFLMAAFDAAEICVRLADRETAAALYSTLQPFAGLHAIAHAHAPYQGPINLALGRLAALRGDCKTAKLHLTSALGSAQEIHALPARALALSELAAIESVRSRARREYGDAALALARRLTMTPLTRRLETLLGVGQRGHPALTRREFEVAKLVWEGLSNTAIAERLTLAERTVENHVSRILIKLGLSSRTAMAVWFERQDFQRSGTD